MPTFTAPTAVPYRSHAQTNANAATPPMRRYPLPAECQIRLAAYGFDQSYEMLLSSFPPAVLNKPSNDSSLGLSDANAILTDYSQPSPMGAGIGQFSASFQIVPATWSDYKLISFTFPGFPGVTGGQYTRDVFTDNVQVRLQHDYYVVDPAGVLGTAPTSGGGIVTTSSVKDSGGSVDVKRVYSLADIPIVAKTNFTTVYSGAIQPSTRVNSLVKSGGESIGGTTWLETMPNREYYQKWITNALANRWTSTVWDGITGLGYTSGTASTVGQFVIEDSRFEALAGNIIDRITTYILAK